MEHRSDDELARIAYGRATDEHGRQRATDAALELDRRRRARLAREVSTANDAAAAAIGAAANGATDDDASSDDATANDASAADITPHRLHRLRRPSLRLTLGVAAAVCALLVIGVTAQLLTPRPSLEIFDTPATADDEAIATRLAIFDSEAQVRTVAVDGESTFFAALSTVDEITRVCVGIVEFDALTLVQCLPVEQFLESGMRNEIPFSPQTGGLRIGDGYRYSWGPTGPFQVEQLPPSE